MNIAKQKEILELRKRVEDLEKEYKEKYASVVEDVTKQYLTAAELDLVEYLSVEGFKVDDSQSAQGQLVARLNTESNGLRGIEYNKKTVLKFKDAMDIMFS